MYRTVITVKRVNFRLLTVLTVPYLANIQIIAKEPYELVTGITDDN